MEYNNNLIGGKRPNRNITKYRGMTLSQRVLAEGKALTAYQIRVGQYSPDKNKALTEAGLLNKNKKK